MGHLMTYLINYKWFYSNDILRISVTYLLELVSELTSFFGDCLVYISRLLNSVERRRFVGINVTKTLMHANALKYMLKDKFMNANILNFLNKFIFNYRSLSSCYSLIGLSLSLLARIVSCNGVCLIFSLRKILLISCLDKIR